MPIVLKVPTILELKALCKVVRDLSITDCYTLYTHITWNIFSLFKLIKHLVQAEGGQTFFFFFHFRVCVHVYFQTHTTYIQAHACHFHTQAVCLNVLSAGEQGFYVGKQMPQHSMQISRQSEDSQQASMMPQSMSQGQLQSSPRSSAQQQQQQASDVQAPHDAWATTMLHRLRNSQNRQARMQCTQQSAPTNRLGEDSSISKEQSWVQPNVQHINNHR